MSAFINVTFLRSPWNWATVALMALFGLMLLAFLFPEDEVITQS
jgi:prepilin signal peptidase PulO-like enzyme (type II secretory pathway)